MPGSRTSSEDISTATDGSTPCGSVRPECATLCEAEVLLALTPEGPHTHVEIQEDAVIGPATLVPQPLRGWAIEIRNVETMRRLPFIAENRAVT
jgi:hypothetical protein